MSKKSSMSEKMTPVDSKDTPLDPPPPYSLKPVTTAATSKTQLPLNELPSEVSLYLLEQLATSCSPSALLNLLLINKDMYFFFSKALYRTLVMDRENARGVCSGIDWDMKNDVLIQKQEIAVDDIKTKIGLLSRIKRSMKSKQQDQASPSSLSSSSSLDSKSTHPPFKFDPISVHHRKITLLNYVKSLNIKDIEAAICIANSIGPRMVPVPGLQGGSATYPSPLPPPPTKIFQNVENLTIEIDLMCAEINYYGRNDFMTSLESKLPNPQQALHILSNNLKPRNVCSNYIRGFEKPWQLMILKLDGFISNWNIESFTWHSQKGLIGFTRHLSINTNNEVDRNTIMFFPKNVPILRCFNHPSLTEGCSGSREGCECTSVLIGILAHLNSEDWSDEEKNTNRKVELIGYRCLKGISTEELMEIAIQSKGITNGRINVDQRRNDWNNRKKWIEDNFEILDMGKAEDCICCTKKEI